MTEGRRIPDEESGVQVFAAWVRHSIVTIRATGRRGLLLTLTGAALGVVIALVLPASYTSTASFIAQATNTTLPSSLFPSALQGLAASFGLGSAKDYSPQFYADLLTSDPVLTTAVTRRYDVGTATPTEPQTYIEFEGLADKAPAAAVDDAVRHLRRRTTARADVRTNIISLSVTSRAPALSRAIAATLMQALDSINIGFRQEQSRELREYFQARVDDAQRALDSAETSLREFLERNRVTQNSPLLQFEEMRLNRRADLKRAVYTTVVQQFEEAKIQEARNVPVLTVLAGPNLPVRKSGPPRRLIAALGLLTGLLVALGVHWAPLLLREAR